MSGSPSGKSDIFIFFFKVEGDITTLIFFIKKVGEGTAEGYRFAASPYLYFFSKWRGTSPLS
jgi:hypothetical protein